MKELYTIDTSEYISHYGRKGMKWGKNIFGDLLSAVGDAAKNTADKVGDYANDVRENASDFINNPEGYTTRDQMKDKLDGLEKRKKEMIAKQNKEYGGDNRDVETTYSGKGQYFTSIKDHSGSATGSGHVQKKDVQTSLIEKSMAKVKAGKLNVSHYADTVINIVTNKYPPHRVKMKDLVKKNDVSIDHDSTAKKTISAPREKQVTNNGKGVSVDVKRKLQTIKKG